MFQATQINSKAVAVTIILLLYDIVYYVFAELRTSLAIVLMSLLLVMAPLEWSSFILHTPIYENQ